jgi:NADH-quinone oxidoreductase subunit C
VSLEAPAETSPLTPIADELRAALGDAIIEITEIWGHLNVRVPPAKRPETLAVLKTLGFDYYDFGCGVDWPDEGELEVFDNVYSTRQNARVNVRCRVPRDDAKVPTATTVYGGSDWHEREAWELFGIVFVGHPRLRRLLLADWQEGFPMRKDEVLRPRVEKPWPGEFFEA